MLRAVNGNFLCMNRTVKEKHPTKVVIRRLPPSFTLDTFLGQISPLPKYNYLYFVKSDNCNGVNAFSRAYINFDRYDDVLKFREKFDNYLFLGPNGTEYSAVVEFAPSQNVPEDVMTRKKDVKTGTIQFDSYYTKFLDRIRFKDVKPQRPEFYFQQKTENEKKTCMTPLLKYVNERKRNKNTTGGGEKLCFARNFSTNQLYENSIVFLNSTAKKSHRRNATRKLTFVNSYETKRW